MINRELLHCYNESIRIAKTRFTAWSDEATVTVAVDSSVPSVPTLAAAAADQSIDLTITAPTTNTDGTSIVDIKDYTIYYSTSSGIDITNPATYSGTFNTASTQHTFPTDAQHWFKAVANDKWSNSSTGSSEVNATPTVAGGVPVSVDDYTDNINQVIVGDGIIGIEFQVPKTTWERFVSWKLYAEDDAGGGSLPGSPTWALIYTGSGPGFVYKNLNTAWLYEFKLVVLGEDGTVTSGTISDNSGAGHQPNGANNDNVVAIEIFAENITATNEIRASHIKASTITGDKLALTSYLAINSSTFGTDGIQLEYNSGNPRAYVGDGANAYVDFDGTKLTWKAANTELDASGNLTATSVNLTGAITASSGSVGSFTIGTYLYTGSKTAYNDANAGVHLGSDGIGIGNNLFTVSAAGAVNATNLTITGGSININSGVFTVSAAGAVACSALTVTGTSTWGGVDIGYGHIASNAVRTAELYVDGDINMGPGGVWNGIYNCEFIRSGTTASATNKPHILLTGTTLHLNSGTDDDYDLELKSKTTIDLDATTNIILTAGAGYDIILTAGDDIVLNAADAAAPMYIKDWWSTGGAQGSAAGRVLVNVDGAVRYLRLYTN